MKIKYMSDDGILFDSIDECTTHEQGDKYHAFDGFHNAVRYATNAKYVLVENDGQLRDIQRYAEKEMMNGSFVGDFEKVGLYSYSDYLKRFIHIDELYRARTSIDNLYSTTVDMLRWIEEAGYSTDWR